MVIQRKEVAEKCLTSITLFPKKEGTREKVCQTFFLNTLGVSHQVVKTVAKKLTTEGSKVTLDKDNRGRHTTVKSQQKQSVKDHINSFDVVESHYIRKDSSKRYLPPSLNISKMYKMYVDYCKEKVEIPVRDSMYRWIFVNYFNLGFHAPKKDQCDLCVNYQNSSANKKLHLEKVVEEHLLNKTSMRQQKEEDKLRASTDEILHGYF